MRAHTALASMLREMAAEVDAAVTITLWDDEAISMRADPDAASADDVQVRIVSPGAVAAMARRPSLSTFVEIVARGGIVVENVSPLEASRAWEHIRVVRYFQKLGVRGIIKRLWPFALLPKGRTGGMAYGGADDAAMQVRHHYDVSNEFYRLFLDERMVYSCAYFEEDDTTLDEAQRAKLEMSCRKLRLTPGCRVLDIGCGWGAFAIHAARHYGAKVHGITLSLEQHALAVERVKEAGLEDLVTIEMRDWKDIEPRGQYDAVVQIGMFEHVAQRDQDAFLAHVHEFLAMDGRYLHHAITRRLRGSEKAFRAKSQYAKVIDTYIFPGSHLDHIGRTVASLERNAFEVHDVEDWRWNYARTCALWSERLWKNREAAVAEVGEDVTRMWLLYLAMVAVGFERNNLLIYQTVATRRRAAPPVVPATRADLYLEPASGE